METLADDLITLITRKPPCPACLGTGRADATDLLRAIAVLIAEALDEEPRRMPAPDELADLVP